MNCLYVSEYAKSGRSKCRKCFKLIQNETLRMGVMKEVCIMDFYNFNERTSVFFNIACFDSQICSVGRIRNMHSYQQVQISSNTFLV